MPATSPVPPAPLVHEIGLHGSPQLLASMAREGLLVPVGSRHFLRADAAGWPCARRVAIGRALGPGIVAGLDTAVWALGGPCPAPGRLTGIVNPRTGGRPGIEDLRILRTTITEQDTLSADGLTFTTPLRTALDLIFLGGSDLALAWLVDLLGIEVLTKEVWARHRVPGLQRAREVLRLLAPGQPDPVSRVRSGPSRSGRRCTPRTPA